MVLPNWMKKSIVILISIITLGMVTPNDLHWLNEASASSSNQSNMQEDHSQASEQTLPYEDEIDRSILLSYFNEKAEETCFVKFGDKIKPKIEDDFLTTIFPKIEEILSTYINELTDEELASIAITDTPSSGTGEKIFNLYDQQSGEDIIRFHVRRENPPKQGHWFNFHYHKKDDNFITHYDLGNLYWDKNTPPNWCSTDKKNIIN